MIILTARLPKINFALGTALTTMLCTCALVLVKPSSQTVMSSEYLDKEQMERLAYLRELGWEVEETPLAQQRLLIPAPLDESYQDYLALQSQQGFPSLTLYQGETVERYTYLIQNYPSGEEGVQVNLLVYEGDIIGGEVLSPQVNGFLHGLTLPSLPLDEDGH